MHLQHRQAAYLFSSKCRQLQEARGLKLLQGNSPTAIPFPPSHRGNPRGEKAAFALALWFSTGCREPHPGVPQHESCIGQAEMSCMQPAFFLQPLSVRPQMETGALSKGDCPVPLCSQQECATSRPGKAVLWPSCCPPGRVRWDPAAALYSAWTLRAA